MASIWMPLKWWKPSSKAWKKEGSGWQVENELAEAVLEFVQLGTLLMKLALGFAVGFLIVTMYRAVKG